MTMIYEWSYKVRRGVIAVYESESMRVCWYLHGGDDEAAHPLSSKLRYIRHLGAHVVYGATGVLGHQWVLTVGAQGSHDRSTCA